MLWPLHHGLTVIVSSGSPAEHKCQAKPHEILPLSPTILENNSGPDAGEEAGQEITGNHRSTETIPLVDQSKTQVQTQDRIRVDSGTNHSQWASEASRLPVGTYWRCDSRITGTSVGNLVRNVFIGVMLTESALDDVRLLAALAFIHNHSYNYSGD